MDKAATQNGLIPGVTDRLLDVSVPLEVQTLDKLLATPKPFPTERRRRERYRSLAQASAVYESEDRIVHETPLYLRDRTGPTMGFISPVMIKPGTQLDMLLPGTSGNVVETMVRVTRCRQFRTGWFSIAATRVLKEPPRKPQGVLGWFHRIFSPAA